LKAGLDNEKASATADVLVEADLLDHDTHGLALLALYLADVESGGMAKSGAMRSGYTKQGDQRE
jgi:L-lactate dehydrogenase